MRVVEDIQRPGGGSALQSGEGAPVERGGAVAAAPEPVRVRSLERSRFADWNAYVESAPAGTFFHLAEWAELVEQVFGHTVHSIYAECGGRIRGVLPLVAVRSRLFGRALCSTPFAVYGGAVADTPAIASRLEDEAAQLAGALRLDHLELRNFERNRSGWPRKELYVTFRKTLAPEPEQNLKAIPRKQRAMVRKGIKAGLQSRVEQDLDHFWPIYASSVRDHGTPVFSRRWFEALKSRFGERCEITTVSDGDTPVSSVMSFYFRDEVLPYYGGGLPRARALKAFDFMYWELMRRSCEAGVRVFDYGRSKQGTGSWSFKKNWGFEPQPLPYQYRLLRGDQLPDVNPLNPRYRAFIAIWQRLPLPLANALGPLVSRALG